MPPAHSPAILDMVVSYLDKINAEAARKDDKYAFFRNEEEYEDIEAHKLGIAAVEQDIDAHRKDAASKLSKKSPVTYVTVAGIEYLIEVSNSDLKQVPASWVKISGTKKLSRFHTPEVVRLISERDQHKGSSSPQRATLPSWSCSSPLPPIISHFEMPSRPLRLWTASYLSPKSRRYQAIANRPFFRPTHRPPSL